MLKRGKIHLISPELKIDLIRKKNQNLHILFPEAELEPDQGSKVVLNLKIAQENMYQ